LKIENYVGASYDLTPTKLLLMIGEVKDANGKELP
jgi:hypothetical protein